MSRDKLVQALGAEVRANQAVVDALDEAVAGHLGVNRTDLRCIDLLLSELGGEATPGQLGARMGLSTGSVTAMIDRLERIGYVSRSPDPKDRRKVVVRATDAVTARSDAIYLPLAMDGAAMVGRYTEPEIELIIDFMRRSRALQEEHLARVRALKR